MIDSEVFAIKGIQNGLVILISPTEDWRVVSARLAEHIDQRISFFEGANITVEVGDRPVPKYELSSLKALLERRGLKLTSVVSTSATTLDSATALNLQTNISDPEETRISAEKILVATDFMENAQAKEESLTSSDLGLLEIPTELDLRLEIIEDVENEEDLFADTTPIDPEETGLPGILIRHTLRSGRAAQSQGHVLIYGDVNPGAKVVAGGDIIIWGRLRGMVHAGANGDESAVVCALEMNPTQLRIAGHIATPPDQNHRRSQAPEIAFIRENRIIVELWDGSKG